MKFRTLPMKYQKSYISRPRPKRTGKVNIVLAVAIVVLVVVFMELLFHKDSWLILPGAALAIIICVVASGRN